MIGLIIVFIMNLIYTSYFESYPEESQYAVNFTLMHKTEIENIKKFLSSEDARLAICIVAPEVSQYSRISDNIETLALYTLYVHGKASDFSIGVFQMKPSFAVSIEEEIIKCNYLKKYRMLIINESSDRLTRCKRLERLSCLDWQLVYLCAFIEIARARTSNILFDNVEEKLKYWATLYNAGLNLGENEVYRFYEFYGFPSFTLNSYNYSDVCIEFYRNKKYCSYL